MSIKSESYARRPFIIAAVRVTEDNMESVAAWAGGVVRQDEGTTKPYIKVEVRRALYGRQTMAFAGDWVLKAGTGFRVYTNAAFEKSFEVAIEPLPPLTEITHTLPLTEITHTLPLFTD